MKYSFSPKCKFVHVPNKIGTPKCQGLNSKPENWKLIDIAPGHEICPMCEPAPKLNYQQKAKLNREFRVKHREALRIRDGIR